MTILLNAYNTSDLYAVVLAAWKWYYTHVTEIKSFNIII